MTDKTIKELLTSSTTKSDVPHATEEFSNYVVEESEKGRKLAGVIAATEEDLDKGESDNVKVPFFPTAGITAPGESGSNDMTSNNYSASSTSVSLTRYGTSILLGEESIYHCSYNLVERLLDAIARGWGNKKDSVVCSQLQIDGSATLDTGTTPVVAVSGTDYTSTPVNLFSDIQSVVENLHSNDLDNLDYMVISPEAEASLIDLQQDTNNHYSITMNDGRIDEVLGIPVIVSSYVTDYSSATADDAYLAVIDSSRVLAEANGKPAKYEEERDSSKDAWEQNFNAYWGVGRIQNDSDTPEYGVVYK